MLTEWCVAAMPVPAEWAHIDNMKVNITTGVAWNYNVNFTP